MEEIVAGYREMSIWWGVIWVISITVGMILGIRMREEWRRGGDNVGIFVILGMMGMGMMVVGIYGVLYNAMGYIWAEVIVGACR